jgi:hypothetical protein
MLTIFNFKQQNGDQGRFDADCWCPPRIGETVVRGDQMLFEVVRVAHLFVAAAAGPPTQMVTVSLEELEIVDDE